MTGVHAAHGAGAGAHHQRLGGGTVAAVANALEDVAVGDAGGGEEDVLAGAEVVGGEHAVEVVAGVDRRLALTVIARPEAAEQLPTHRLQGGGGEHALGRAADPPEQIHGRAFADREQGSGDVAVADQR